MAYTVNQLGKLAGVSVRTLHHYDEIGLLTPSFIKENGYRYYEDKELITLQQILFFRELEFPLEQIKQIIQSPNFNVLEALDDQKKMLQLEKKRIDGLLATITNSISKMKNNQKVADNELYGDFSKQQMEEYQAEAKQRWGNTEAWKQSQERTKHWTKEDYKRIKEDGEKGMRAIVAVMDKGIKDPEVQNHIHNVYMSMQQFYDCSYEMFRNLGQMYVNDKRFTAYYDKFHPKLAEFMRDAMAYYSDQHSK